MINKYGYWETGGLEFNRKFEALHRGTINKTDVYFKYHNKIWDNFDRSLLGQQSLNNLYKERALQLRDKYDYLILYYSGGSDSHNVLRTFIDNNIKLDEICVKWPKALADGKLYKPNSIDTTARNYWSEWDYSVKPTLDWLKSAHPNIKINIRDYINNVDKIHIEALFENLNHIRSGAMLQSGTYGDTALPIVNKGKSVGHLYGIDKPVLSIKEHNKVYMSFSDLALSLVSGDISNYYSGECFYWAPDYPILAFEMAYKVSDYYNINKEARKYLQWSGDPKWNVIAHQCQNDITKKVCYDTWDFRFQADKPVSFNRTDKWFWFFETNEFSNVKDAYISTAKSYTNLISDLYVTKYDDGSAPSISTLSTTGFYVRTLDA